MTDEYSREAEHAFYDHWSKTEAARQAEVERAWPEGSAAREELKSVMRRLGITVALVSDDGALHD